MHEEEITPIMSEPGQIFATQKDGPVNKWLSLE